jgi:uncharacterized protein YcnI
MRPHTLRRGAAVAALSTGLALLAGVAPASAHVRVSPDSAAPGTYSKLTFRVPDELPDASTVKLEIAFPADQPIASVSVRPLPGWTVSTQKRTLAAPLTTDDGEITSAVSRVVWSGGKIEPGQFQEFDVSVRVPDKGDTMVFKALQTYDNGEVVRWIDPPAAGGGAEPEHPAPVLKLVKTGAATATASEAPASGAPAPEAASASAAGGDDGTARALGWAALALALLAAAVAVVTRIRPARGGKS